MVASATGSVAARDSVRLLPAPAPTAPSRLDELFGDDPGPVAPIPPRRPFHAKRWLLPLVFIALTCWSAKGGGYKTWAVRAVRENILRVPGPAAVFTIQPSDGQQEVSRDARITVLIDLPTSGIDDRTLTPLSVSLYRLSDSVRIPATLSTLNDDTIVLQPATPLEPDTDYMFRMNGRVRTVAGGTVAPLVSFFRTTASPATANDGIAFEQVSLPTAGGAGFTSVQVGPDRKLYAGTDDGRILRFPIEPDGTLCAPQVIDSLKQANHGPRLLIGFCFDPGSTAERPVVWASHGYFGFANVPDFTGKITRLSGTNLETVEDAVIHLPRSVRDHVNNQPAFGPDGALYFPQGSSSASGAPDAEWGNRPERLLSASILRLDPAKLPKNQPLDALTPDGGGTYDPAASGAPLTIYASGIRNAYDLVWASNGRLYVPVNGSNTGGNAPAGPRSPGLHNIRISEDDWLFKIIPGKYYGHPNPAQHHYVLNGGNPAGVHGIGRVSQYPVGTLPEPDWTPATYNFSKHVSADGIVEYRGNAFGGKLDRALLVCRFNVGCDLIVLTLDSNGDVASARTGIPGFTNLANPLDIAEDLQTGFLYVAEYGGKKITLLRPASGSVRAVAAPESGAAMQAERHGLISHDER